MSNKNSKIVKSTFTTEWKAPNGAVLYYHELVMENGDKGTCGIKEKSPPRIWNGAYVTYTIDEKNKIKIIFSDMDNQPQPQTSSSGKTYTKQNTSKQDTFIGYAWSYAKDLIIAGKTMEDVEELNKVARFIYDEIGKMLQNEQQ
jgi:hypothetical protein